MDLHLSETILSLSVTVELLTLEDSDKLKKTQVFSDFFSEDKEGLFAAFGQEHLAKSQAMTQPSVEQNPFLIILPSTISLPQVSWMFWPELFSRTLCKILLFPILHPKYAN